MKIVKLHSIIALGLFALLAACGNDNNDNSVDLQTLKVGVGQKHLSTLWVAKTPFSLTTT